MSIEFDIQEELKKLPTNPGVYLMHDANDTIIYVGKAINLRNRVRSYFRESTKKSLKIQKMVTHIQYFEYIITDSELEALVLENNLIKEHNPHYNTMLKDDKTYPYIKVTLGEEYPRVLFSREMKKDRSRYFGPFTSAGAVNDAVELTNKLFELRTCRKKFPRDFGIERPCLNYHIHQCMAPCRGCVSREEYGDRIKQALEFLNGNFKTVMKELEDKMNEASENMEFEEAIRYRDLLSSVKSVNQRQKITDSDGEDKDVIAMAREERDAVVQVFFIRNGRLIGREHFFMSRVEESEDTEILSAFVKQFYAGTPFIPREIMMQIQLEDSELIGEWLSSKRGSRVTIRTPKIGSKEKLVELAYNNASLVLNRDKERIKREEGRTIGAVKEIEGWLNLKSVERMEAFDISNTSGFANVGSMVVFEKGKPKKSDYRKFKMKTVAGPDDYACMKEVLTRRFVHGLDEKAANEQKNLDDKFGSFTRFPDLLLMDGGRGQVNIALEVLRELELDIPVCGMVKDDNHRTRGLYFNNVEIDIDTHSEGFKLITRIQDEAHRFAITYHRSLRSQTQVKSVLDDIPGVGEARRKALMKHFQNVEAIKAASIEELMEVPQIPEHIAIQIKNFFNGS